MVPTAAAGGRAAGSPSAATWASRATTSSRLAASPRRRVGHRRRPPHDARGRHRRPRGAASAGPASSPWGAGSTTTTTSRPGTRQRERQSSPPQIASGPRPRPALVIHPGSAWDDTSRRPWRRGRASKRTDVPRASAAGPTRPRRCLDLGAHLSFSGSCRSRLGRRPARRRPPCARPTGCWSRYRQPVPAPRALPGQEEPAGVGRPGRSARRWPSAPPGRGRRHRGRYLTHPTIHKGIET